MYAGDRATKFEKRLQGASYEEIAQSGGGINSTVTQTRKASQQVLYAQADSRLTGLMNEGVTTLEIKSGYGLDSDNEIKMLRVADQLAKTRQIRIQKTFLGAHTLPPEYASQKDAYIDQVCNVMLPAAFEAGLVDAVDGFCESIAFSVEQMQRVFDEARLLAANKTVAVLLPGAFYTLDKTQKPPVKALRECNVPIAIATDLNPGSSPLNSLLLAMNMACTLFSLTPIEALAGTTINAAKALGLDRVIGSLAVGKSADLVIWNTDNPAMFAYQIGANPCLSTMVAGEWRKNKFTDQEPS